MHSLFNLKKISFLTGLLIFREGQQYNSEFEAKESTGGSFPSVIMFNPSPLCAHPKCLLHTGPPPGDQSQLEMVAAGIIEIQRQDPLEEESSVIEMMGVLDITELLFRFQK